MKRITCVLSVLAILAGPTQGIAQKGPVSTRAGEELRKHVLVAFIRSKRISIKVNDPRDLSGAGIKNSEVSGLVRSFNDSCFRLEYKDGRKTVQSDCIPYTDAAIVTWQAKARHFLRVAGEDSAIGAVGVVALPLIILVFVTAALIGHPISGC